MKLGTLLLVVMSVLICSLCLAWIDIPEDWKEVDVNFSHAIYLTPDGILMTACHSCNAKIPLEEADKIVIDRSSPITKRLNEDLWDKIRHFFKGYERDEIVMYDPSGKVVVSEELYYCKEHNFK